MLRSFVLFILLLFSLQALAQSQPQFRLRSFSRQMVDWKDSTSLLVTDSAYYYYPGNRQGILSWQLAEYLSYARGSQNGEAYLYYAMQPSLCYDSVVTFAVLPSKRAFTQASTYKQTFDNQGRIVTHQWGVQTPENFIYSGNDLVEHTNDHYYNAHFTYRYKNGLLDSLLEEHYQSNLSNAITKYNYNSSGQLTSTQTYYHLNNDSAKTLYFYDSNNRLNKKLIFKTLLPANYIKKFDTADLITYVYTTGADVQREEHSVHITGTDSLILSETHDNMYDAAHNKLQDICVTNDGFSTALDDSFKRTYTYNTYGLITKLESQRWYNGKWDYRGDTIYQRSSHIFTFNYELYWPTSVSQTKEKETDVKLYPSPASDFIRIETEWKNAISFTVAIYDIQGRLERQWQEQGIKTYSRTVPLSELPAGMYILKMKCGDEEVAKQFIISK
jgi:hypothetical protein